MSNLTKVSCEYTGGNIYVYQAMYKGKYWIYGSLDEWMYAFSIEPFRYQHRNDCGDAPWHRELRGVEFPTWREIADSLRQEDADVGYNVTEPLDIIHWMQLPDVPSNIEVSEDKLTESRRRLEEEGVW